jgi:hypothetical protein
VVERAVPLDRDLAGLRLLEQLVLKDLLGAKFVAAMTVTWLAILDR